jgi:tetratricopeptide (TPR) repeat protein
MTTNAQTTPSARADSTLDSLYNAANWKGLIKKGKALSNKGESYPSLYLKIGYAEFALENYSAAIGEYNKILEKNPHDQTARYYLYLCYLYLKNESMAGYELAKLDSNTLKVSQTSHNGLNGIDAGTSFKIADDPYRGNASFTQADVDMHLFSKLQVLQSLSYFGQYIYTTGDDRKEWIQHKDQQNEYFLKLSYPLMDKLTLIGGWHYAHATYSTYSTDVYNNHLFVIGLNYAEPYFSLQGNVELGHVLEDKVTQYDGRLVVNPLGNYNLYLVTGASYLLSGTTRNMIFSEMAGFKVVQRFWLETSATFGNLNDYIENDGLYIYDALDVTKLKLAETAYFQLNKRLMLDVSYTYEKKYDDDVHKAYYSQHSIAVALSWRF